MNPDRVAAPGEQTLGVLGGGQLGRLLALDAQQAGITVVVRTDEPPNGPAEQVAAHTFRGAYSNDDANSRFLSMCNAVTVEFENLPASLLSRIEASTVLRPGAWSIGICQHRRREKEFLAAHGFPHASFAIVRSARELEVALEEFGHRAILKTASFGYDGRGQIRFSPNAGPSAEAAWAELNAPEGVLEAFVSFICELSVVGVRSHVGAWVPYAPGENIHRNGILDYTVAPARIDLALAAEAQRLAGSIATALDHVGTIGVEFFVHADGSLVVNEMAPRPHNSGHHTIDACLTSQFGQQWRAALGYPLGDPTQVEPAVMMNLLGDWWASGEPNWELLNDEPTARLHLYGKAEARPGRKMGHLTVLTSDVDFALALRERLTR